MGDEASSEESCLAPARFSRGQRPPVQRVRGSVIASSLNAARAAGREEPYFRELSDDAATQIRAVVTSAWLPVELALAHYDAMNRIGFSSREAHENGRFVVQRIEGSFIATVVKGLGRQVGPTPLLQRIPTARDRMLDGGDVAVFVDGRKDARIEMLGTCLARYEYVRHGWAGMFEGILDLVTHHCFAKVVPTPDPEERTVICLSWV